ncbi:MAG: hypothetical protein LBT15_04490 [Synergistaceae bacterium]|jgi:hypothetical protein|nr:hypothetical protein [Synergistaceae bacterium]
MATATERAKPDPKVFDPLTATGEELEAIRGELAGDAENKKAEFARFREDTLRRLSDVCDRTIETARMEEERVKARVAGDREEIDARVAGLCETWRDRLSDDGILDALVTEIVRRLLPNDLLAKGGERS